MLFKYLGVIISLFRKHTVWLCSPLIYVLLFTTFDVTKIERFGAVCPDYWTNSYLSYVLDSGIMSVRRMASLQ